MKNLLSASVYLMILFLLTGTAAGCTGRAAEDVDDGRIGVIVSIQPQAEFAERVGGDKVKVTVMIPPGASPHTYEPAPVQLVEVSESEIYAKVGTGIEFELTWMDKIINTGGEILVSPEIYNRLAGDLLVESTREVNLKGIEGTQTLYQVVGLNPAT